MKKTYNPSYIDGKWVIIYIPTGELYQEGGLWDTQEEAEWVAQNLEWDQWVGGWVKNKDRNN